MPTQHLLTITLDGRPPKGTNGKHVIYIRYQHGNLKKRKSTSHDILKDHWDSKASSVKTEFENNYLGLLKDLNGMKQQFPELRVALREGSITYTTAFDKLLKKGLESINLIEFVKNSKDLTPKDRKKYIERFRALENKHFPKKYVPLTTTILGDEYAIKDMSQIMKEKSDMDGDYIHSVMYNLDRCGRLAGNVNFDLFKRLNLRPKLKDPDPTGIDYLTLAKGMNEIKTLQDLEAFLFWLYSFCLLGLDFNDIVNLDESLIEYDKSNDHYYPDAEFDEDRMFMNTKVHMKFRRKKSSVPMVLLVNLFPTLLIRDWLHYIVGHTRPHLVYRGKDRFRIFNFKTINSKGADDMEGVAIKTEIASTYRKKNKKQFGGTLQQTRHTVTGVGAELGLSETELDRQLGHAIKGVLRNYLKTQQIPKDVNHTHIIQEFGIIKILYMLMGKFNRNYQMANSEQVPFVLPNFGLGINKKKDQEFFLLKNAELSRWTRANEVRYQQLMAKVTKGNAELDKNGNVVQTGATEVDYPEELKELIEERDLLIYKQNKERFKKGKAKMIEKFRKGEEVAELYYEREVKTNLKTGEVIITEDPEIQEILDATIEDATKKPFELPED